MKRSKFTDEHILAIVKEREAGRKVADLWVAADSDGVWLSCETFNDPQPQKLCAWNDISTRFSDNERRNFRLR